MLTLDMAAGAWASKHMPSLSSDLPSGQHLRPPGPAELGVEVGAEGRQGLIPVAALSQAGEPGFCLLKSDWKGCPGSWGCCSPGAGLQ